MLLWLPLYVIRYYVATSIIFFPAAFYSFRHILRFGEAFIVFMSVSMFFHKIHNVPVTKRKFFQFFFFPSVFRKKHFYLVVCPKNMAQSIRPFNIVSNTRGIQATAIQHIHRKLLLEIETG